MTCKKCNEIGSITIRKEHVYCDNCFMQNLTHKFRACIGKNKILSKFEKVLICITGGPSSAVLIDLVFNSISQESHKQLRIIPFFLHVTGFGNKDRDLNTAEIVLKQCEKYKFNVYIVNCCKFYTQKLNTLPDLNNLPDLSNCSEDDVKVNLKKVLLKMAPTSNNDIETKIKHNIFIRVANKLNCKFIFTAETTTTLAINLLSNLVIGRGSQVEDDVGFFDKRNEKIKLLRPMKDITEEELHHYIRIKDLIQTYNNNFRQNSLQSVIKDFVLNLQEDFPATVSTVYKTAEKIGTTEKKEKKCQFCQSSIGLNSDKITAVEATNFSRTVSNCQPYNYYKTENGIPEKPTNVSMSTFVDNQFCYSCSKNCLQGEVLDIIQLNLNNINQQVNS